MNKQSIGISADTLGGRYKQSARSISGAQLTETETSMSTAWPEWDFSRFDPRGNWVPKREDRHYLSGWANVHRYEFERESEGLDDSEIELLDRTRAHLRRARARGYLHTQDETTLRSEEVEFLSEACRCEGIPVLSDYPISMQSAVRSYGELLAAFFFVIPKLGEKSEPLEGNPEAFWAARLANTLRRIGRLHIAQSDEEFLGWEFQIPGHTHRESLEVAKSQVDAELTAFNKVAHEFPDLLQSFITLGDHFKLRIPSLRPVSQPTKEIWSALDVTSNNFAAMLRAQPGYFNAMSGHQFELLVARLFRDQGFEVISTKQSHDGGYDLRIAIPITGKLKTAFLVECKNPKDGNVTGVSVVRGLRGISDNDKRGTAGGVLVTSTRFSETARREALASGWNLTLFEKNDLLEMLDLIGRVTA